MLHIYTRVRRKIPECERWHYCVRLKAMSMAELIEYAQTVDLLLPHLPDPDRFQAEPDNWSAGFDRELHDWQEGLRADQAGFDADRRFVDSLRDHPIPS